MNFDLRSPCGNCPFRSDKPEQRGWLGEDRAQEIVDSLDQHTFPCHKTTVSSGNAFNRKATADSQHCAGALIMLEKMNKPSQMMRIAERLGIYDRTELVMDAPVFAESSKFVLFHGEE